MSCSLYTFVLYFKMASQPVTPQRVRDVLSSFLFDREKETSSTPPKVTKSPLSSDGSTDGLSPSTGPAAYSPQIAVNRRSFASFLNRVNTFSSRTWFAKPSELSPMVCSRYGWENKDYDMLHCTACGADLCAALPAIHNSKAYGEACEQLKEKLQKAHEKFCTLAVNPCPEAYLKLGLHDSEELGKDFQERLNMLKKSTSLLPELTYTHMEAWGFAESHAAKYVAEENLPEDISTQVITLAFTGWTLSESNPEIVQCTLCCRHIGLWLFKPAKSAIGPNGRQRAETPDESGDAGPPSKLRKIDIMSEMDPITSHYAWCPWIALRVPTEDNVTYFNPHSVATADNGCPSASDNGNPGVSFSSSTVPASGPLTTAPASDVASSPVSSRPTARDNAASSAVSSSPVSSRPTARDNAQTPKYPTIRCFTFASPAELTGDAKSDGVSEALSGAAGHKQPAWVLAVRLVAPGLLSQSRRLVQKVKQSSVAEGLHCIRKMLQSWVSPEHDKSLNMTNLST